MCVPSLLPYIPKNGFICECMSMRFISVLGSYSFSFPPCIPMSFTWHISVPNLLSVSVIIIIVIIISIIICLWSDATVASQLSSSSPNRVNYNILKNFRVVWERDEKHTFKFTTAFHWNYISSWHWQEWKTILYISRRGCTLHNSKE